MKAELVGEAASGILARVLSDRFLAWFTSTLPDGGVKASGRTQAGFYRLSGGRLCGRFGRGPVLVLTTVGRRSGQPRRTTVLYARDDGRLVVIGSNTGSERPPAWALNLLETPEAEVQIGRERMRRAGERGRGQRARAPVEPHERAVRRPRHLRDANAARVQGLRARSHLTQASALHG